MNAVVSSVRHPAFHACFLAHRGAVLRLCVGMVGPVDAEDAFQETFLKVLRAWPAPVEGAALRAWVLTTAHRTAIDLLRARGRELPAAELPERGLDDPDVLATLEAAPLWAAVRALAPKQRAAVVLRIVLDQSHAQVADVLGCSEAAARRSYADGVAALRRTMEVTR